MICSVDFETRATVDLRVSGVYPYAQHPDTDLWCMAYAFDDEEPEIWYPGLPFPERLRAHIETGGELRAHNAQFERVIWRYVAILKHGFPVVQDNQWVCSAAEAAAMSLPRSLDECARVLGVTDQKDVDGYSLMLRMTRPRRILDDGTLVWWDVEDRKQRLYEYCKQDVRTERAISKCLHRLTPRERELYLLDQRINDRGILLDRELADAAKDIAAEGASRANLVLAELTASAVTAVTQTGQLRTWLNDQGVATASVSKPRVAELLESDLSPDVRRVIETRAEAGRSSIAKIDSMQAVACPDGRLRGLLLYHGASTGRWTGKLVQPQNLPRGDIAHPESFIPYIRERAYDLIGLVENPLAVVSSLLRGMLRAAPGHDFVAADFSAIEARVLNWLAGQADVVESFRLYDATKDKQYDPYRRMAVAMGRGTDPATVSAYDRQAGKAAELGCGYGMGAAKFVTAAWHVYQVRVNDAEAKQAVNTYRRTHPNVVNYWYQANAAAIAAVEQPGSVQVFGPLSNCKFSVQGKYLYLVLPAGRALVYPAPRIVERITPWGEPRPAVEFSGVNSYARKWERQSLYGGLIVENIVQAVSRDLMAFAMFRLEAAGYPVVLTVHDEIVCEVPSGFGSVEDMERIMKQVPAWAHGCPVNAEGWRGERYRK